MASPAGSLDAVLALEDEYKEEGAAQARAAGEATGLADGRALGWAAGAAVGAELAFYAGVAAALATLPLGARARGAADRLATASAAVCVDEVGNDPAVDFEAVLAEARERFRSATALAGVGRVRWDAGKPARLTDYSF
jgi:hypothetical protein